MAGILGEDRLLRENHAGTPQGSILVGRVAASRVG